MHTNVNRIYTLRRYYFTIMNIDSVNVAAIFRRLSQILNLAEVDPFLQSTTQAAVSNGMVAGVNGEGDWERGMQQLRIDYFS